MKDYFNGFYDINIYYDHYPALLLDNYFLKYFPPADKDKRILYNRLSSLLFSSMSRKDLHYHTPIHLLSMFQVAEQLGLSLSRETGMAILFHDSIYYPGHGQNEENSVDFFRALISSQLPAETIETVSRAILETKKFADIETSGEFDILLDLDLSGFAARSFKMQTYCIRKEFSFVAEEQFWDGRKKFLKTLLERENIYRTAIFREKFEEIARKNIESEL